ncbi:MAG: methyltransferase type 11 [Anaerolineae bacterium]|nr:MAG: methyltransferase type 11 [Anaerolineae bacterium]
MFDHFDVLAPLYDRAIPFSRLDWMLRVVNLPVDGLVLDAGGGTGRVAAALRPYARDVVVADVSAGMLAQARNKQLTGLRAPSERLPFPENTFPRIIMVDALHHVSNQRQTLAELWRVLQPGGRLVIEEPDIRTWVVKFVAVVEKLALMRSHFLSPPQIVALLPPQAKVQVERESYNAWVIVEK